jgi:hypothetical protein
MIQVKTYNAHQLSKVIRSLQRLLIGLATLLTLLAGFFAYKWYEAASSDVTYLITAEATQIAYKRPASITRDPFELENFTVHFLQNAFAHNEFTYKENLNKALQVMDRKSGLYLKSKFKEEEIEEVYKAYNGISLVEVERIEVNTAVYPYEVAAYYQTKLHFIGLEEGEEKLEADKVAPGAVYFKVTTAPRSRENPYGLLVSQFSFIAYEENTSM